MSVVASTPAAIAAALGLDKAFEASSKHDDDGVDVDDDAAVDHHRGPRGPDQDLD